MGQKVNRTPIVVAAIGAIGVIGAALLGNLDKLQIKSASKLSQTPGPSMQSSGSNTPNLSALDGEVRLNVDNSTRIEIGESILKRADGRVGQHGLKSEADDNSSKSPGLSNAGMPMLAPGGAYVVNIYDLGDVNNKRAEGAIRYNNGNTLRGTFDINCITSAIEPRNFIMTSRDGTILRSGDTWEPPFKTRWPAEIKLYSLVCNSN